MPVAYANLIESEFLLATGSIYSDSFLSGFIFKAEITLLGLFPHLVV